MVHEDGEHRPEEEADEGDGHGILDQRGDDPNGHFQSDVVYSVRERLARAQ